MNLEIIKNINEKKFDQQLKVCFEKQILLTNVYFGVSMYRYETWFIGLESNNYFKRTYDIIVKEIAHLKNIKIVLFQAILEQSNLLTIQ